MKKFETLVSIPDVMGNTAEFQKRFVTTEARAGFNPRCDGEYS